MKDPLGHGSNSRLSKVDGPKTALPHFTPKAGKGAKGGHNMTQIHGGAIVTSNAQAAQSLMSALKSTQAPIHSAMAGRPSPDGGSAS